MTRIISNAMLLAADRKIQEASFGSISSIESLFIGGSILQGIGYSMLFLTVLLLYNCINHTRNDVDRRRQALYFRFLLVINIVATILLIVGIVVKRDVLLGRGTTSPVAKAGSYMYCAESILLSIFLFSQLRTSKDTSRKTKLLIQFALVSMIPMSVRAGYGAYRIQKGEIISYNVWAHLVCQDVIEVFVVLMYILLGFYIHRQSNRDSNQQEKNDEMTSSKI